jgi:hypothetical protein
MVQADSETSLARMGDGILATAGGHCALVL